MTENRDFSRISKEITVDLSELSYPLKNEYVTAVSSKDISGGGICLETMDKFDPQTLLNLKIRIESLEGYKKPYSMILNKSKMLPLTALAEVVWCNDFPNGQGYLTGIRFLDIYEDDYNALIKYLGDSS